MSTRYTFTVRATDSSTPPQVIEREFTLDVDVLSYLAVAHPPFNSPEGTVELRVTPLFPVAQIVPIPGAPKILAFNRQNTRLAVGFDQVGSTLPGIRIINVATGTLVSAPSISATEAPGVAYSPDGSRLLVGFRQNSSNNSFLNVYNTSNNSLVNSIASFNPTFFLGPVSYSPEGAYYAAHKSIWVGTKFDHRLSLYNASTHALVSESTTAFGTAVSMDFSPDGALVAGAYTSANQGILIVRSVPSLAQITTPNLTGFCESVKFSPDGNYLAVMSNPGVFVYRTDNWQLVWSNTNLGIRLGRQSLAWSADASRLFITATLNPWVRVVRTATWTFEPLNAPLPIWADAITTSGVIV